MSGEIAFDLIRICHAQIREPASRSTTTRVFVFLAIFAEFYYHKYLEKKVDGDFSICVDERKPCGLSLTRNINIYKCHMIKR